MKNNIVVVGDSFCLEKSLWPEMLAKKFGLELHHMSVPGGHWWSLADYLLKLSPDTREHTKILVIAHTNSNRIPSKDRSLFRSNLIEVPVTEQDTAIMLYKKYIEDEEFLYWAHKQWVLEIERHWGHVKILHLNCFSWTVNLPFSGVSVVPPLMNISLNELGADDFFATARSETRKNHFSQRNNQVLADELERLLNNYTPGQHHLNLAKFEQVTDKWTNWEWKKHKISYLDKK